MIAALVHLCAQAVYRGTFARVQHPHLDERIVRGKPHFAAHSVDLTHKMPLAGAADGGVAGHEADRVEVQRQQQRRKAHPRRGKRGFAACVSRADHDNIKLFRHFF